jgi:hypothetical protein
MEGLLLKECRFIENTNSECCVPDVVPCTESIGHLTGSNWLLSSCLAIGIDCGLIACEFVSVIED